MSSSLRTIAVDLTPVLPGGENGGAKIFVLELVRRLARLAPDTQFVLLTQTSSHEELGALDRQNVRRVVVIGPHSKQSALWRIQSAGSELLARLPRRLRRAVSRARYTLQALTRQRSGSATLLHEMGVDLLFCPFTAPTYFDPRIPTVCTIYDLQYKAHPEFFDAEDVEQRHQTFIKACRHATALAAISEYSRQAALDHGIIRPASIRTIYLRMAKRPRTGPANENRALNSLDLTPFRYLIYPANFWKHKNHEMLLTAFGIACRTGLAPDIKLVCTGAPSMRREWLITAARNMNLADRVLFPGFIPELELEALLNLSSGLVFPSLYEGFGLPLIEAMAAGIPVACSNTTSLPEVAGGAAILFDPRIPTQIAQALISLAGNETLREELIKAGQKRAAEFSDGDRMAKEYWEVFHYAQNAQNQQDFLTGAYADGWVGASLQIQVTPCPTEQVIEIDLLAPDWLPHSRIKLNASCDTKQTSSLEILRGTKAKWMLPMGLDGGHYEVRIAPNFIPSLSGYGEDTRELSLMLERCEIVREGGNVKLYPEKHSL